MYKEKSSRSCDRRLAITMEQSTWLTSQEEEQDGNMNEGKIAAPAEPPHLPDLSAEETTLSNRKSNAALTSMLTDAKTLRKQSFPKPLRRGHPEALHPQDDK